MHACKVASVMSDSAIPGTVDLQEPLSMRFPKQEYWSGLPCPPLGDLPNKPIDQTHVSCIGRQILYCWATREVQHIVCVYANSAMLSHSVVSNSVIPWTVTHQVPVYGILQVRILEWVAILFSRGSSWSRDWTRVSCVFCIARQVPLVPPGMPVFSTWIFPSSSWRLGCFIKSDFAQKTVLA